MDKTPEIDPQTFRHFIATGGKCSCNDCVIIRKLYGLKEDK